MNAQQLQALINKPASEISDEIVQNAIISLMSLNLTYSYKGLTLECGRRVCTYTLNGHQFAEGFGAMVRRIVEPAPAPTPAPAPAITAQAVEKIDLANLAAFKAQADMPEQDKDGIWVDLETGHAYDNHWNYRTNKPMRGYASEFKTEKGKISEKGQKARDEVKVLGAKALVGGTIKQKQWAEQIRKSKLDQAGSSLQTLLASDSAKKTEFWIQVRFLYVNDIVRVAEVLDNKETLTFHNSRATCVPTKAYQVIQMLKMDEKK